MIGLTILQNCWVLNSWEPCPHSTGFRDWSLLWAKVDSELIISVVILWSQGLCIYNYVSYIHNMYIVYIYISCIYIYIYLSIDTMYSIWNHHQSNKSEAFIESQPLLLNIYTGLAEQRMFPGFRTNFLPDSDIFRCVLAISFHSLKRKAPAGAWLKKKHPGWGKP